MSNQNLTIFRVYMKPLHMTQGFHGMLKHTGVHDLEFIIWSQVTTSKLNIFMYFTHLDCVQSHIYVDSTIK
jgi:hypothetical protein